MPPITRGKNPAFDIAHSTVNFNVAVIGAGAAPPTVPLNGVLTPTTNTFPAAINMVSRVAAEVPTRASAGNYILTLGPLYVHLLPNDIAVVSAGGAPTLYLTADVVAVSPATRQVQVLVQNTATGAATDLGTSDMLVLSLKGIDSGSPA